MAGLKSETGMRGQFTAIARVRWQIFVNSLRTVRGRLELVSRVFMFLGFGVLGLGGAFGLASAAWYFESHGKAVFLAFLFWPIFLFWQLFPVMASAFAGSIDSSNLLRFPLNFRAYVLVRLAFGSLEPATAIGLLWSLGIVIGIAIASPVVVLLALPAVVVFAILNILLARMIFVWVERWLAQRRTRELMGILFFVMIISFQLINPLMMRYGKRAGAAITRGSQEVLPIQRFLPPGLAADSIASASQGEILRSVGGIALQGVYASFILWILNVRLRAQYQGENLSEAVARAAGPAVKGKAKVGWDIPGVSGPVAAIVEKEFHYLSRSGPMLFTFIMPVVVLLIFRFSSARVGGSTDLLARATDLAFPVGAAYTILILTNLVYNSFGGDAVGVQLFFLSPVRFREVFMGKNIAHGIVVAIELFLVWLAVCVLYRMPAIDLTIATVCAVVFAFLVNLSVGDLFSMHSPKKIDYGTLGRQQASGTTAIASLGIQVVVLGLCATVLFLARTYGKIWIAIVAFAILAVAAGVAYALVLKRTDAVAIKNRETMITELSRA